ncbi:hypothetical protein GA0074692_6831 [Micromonospora pallida]|uniref:Uncharacterized protein n=1 Tax=Micromonospora pallida TaxID=145854 RepID=A0A1C6RH38_9ACTN|nr:hypothetical protein [Micromonospora pallida]SCL16487.1 hypothetical protein GA0074692_0040 [Micromonospora pallida]SCL43341.1 hypothetical protein GA0074692_6831 [Micromonospora pallida]
MMAVALAVALVVVAVLAGLLWAADRDRRDAQAENRELRAEVVALRRAAIRSTAAALLTPDDIAAIETYANTHREDGPR